MKILKQVLLAGTAALTLACGTPASKAPAPADSPLPHYRVVGRFLAEHPVYGAEPSLGGGQQYHVTFMRQIPGEIYGYMRSGNGIMVQVGKYQVGQVSTAAMAVANRVWGFTPREQTVVRTGGLRLERDGTPVQLCSSAFQLPATHAGYRPADAPGAVERLVPDATGPGYSAIGVRPTHAEANEFAGYTVSGNTLTGTFSITVDRQGVPQVLSPVTLRVRLQQC